MAAAAATATPLDLRSSSTYPFRLGKSILQPAEARKFTSVRYNHKPRLNEAKNARFSLRRTARDGEELQIQEGGSGGGEYVYSGRDAASTREGEFFVLVSRGKEVVLERLQGGCHEFNLVRTPGEADAGKLAKKFPLLGMEAGAGDEGDEGLFGDEKEEETEVDRGNPWDYRNYLKPKVASSASKGHAAEKEKSAAPASSSTTTTRPQKRANAAAPTTTPAQKKRKTQQAPQTTSNKPNTTSERPKPNPPTTKRSKPSTPPSPSPPPQTHRNPSFSFSLDNDDDTGELILENTSPTTTTKPANATITSAMSLALNGGGPISLRSAASSPAASHRNSPLPPRPQDDGAGKEGEEDQGSEDGDVEDLELPSPAAATVAATQGEDEDDELDKALAEAMAEGNEDEEVARAPVGYPESDEESEEE